MDDLPQHAGMNTEEVPVFRSQIDEALRSGRALLLVDGLDEISDEGARTTFAGHLGTFLAMFPQAAMVVTSREAGYRHVAGVIASACRHVRLAPFDEPDVGRLCESWHVEVVGDTDRVRSDARLPDTPPEPDVIRSLFRLWREADSSELCRFAAWAFGTQPLLSRDAFAPDAWGDCDTWFERTAAKNDLDAAGAPLVLAWYQRSSWSDAELAEKLRNSDPSYRPTAREMLATLGEAGRRVLEKWDAENA